MSIVPMAERRSRLPVAGRIRLGVKARASNGKIKPQAIDRFRFTSRREDDVAKLAELYGGTPRPWSDPKSEESWELISEATEIRVALPPDPLAESYYEMWGGRGLARRCDGETCETPLSGPDGMEWATCSCLCRQRGVKECKPKLRLQVILPELPMRGVWRLDTGSEAALDELPGMVETLQRLQGEGLTVGLLRLERRQSSGGSKRYVVPVLGLAESLEGLVAGRARLAALPSSAGGEAGHAGSVPQLPPAAPEPDRDMADHLYSSGVMDDEVIDAELVDEEPSAAEKARQLRTARSQAILEGREPPSSWEEIDA